MSYTILIPDRLKPPADLEASIFDSNTNIILKEATHASQIEDSVWGECDAVLAWHEIQYSSEVIKKMKKCKAIVRIGVGFDNVDLDAAKASNIAVCNVPDYGTNDVADHAMALLLNLGRSIERYQSTVHDGYWEWDIGIQMHRLQDLTLGIIGLGRIGTAVAQRAKSFGMNIRFYDPYKADGYDKAFGILRDDQLKNLAENSDYISIHTPLTEETNQMVNEDFIKQCKNGVVFINTARGPIIDFDDLYNGLKTKKIGAAGLDVLPVEPADNNHPLIWDWLNKEEWIKGRLIITPHSAFYNQESYAEMRRKGAEEAKRILDGKLPRNPVNGTYPSVRENTR